METIVQAASQIAGEIFGNGGLSEWLLRLFPFFILLELPVYLLIFVGVLRWKLRERHRIPPSRLYTPKVSCIVTCYSEGAETVITLKSLCEQLYPGVLEIIPVVDGASINRETLAAIEGFRVDPHLHPRRTIRPLAKWQRGGRVSSLNAGLHHATGDIVLALDGDTSFDNDMVSQIVQHFADPNVPAVSGNLRVRNRNDSLVARIQALEYLLSIQMSKIGLGEWNTINNISGAFGAFRRKLLTRIGGWDTHTAEDLDITLRIKSYYGRHHFRIPFEPRAIGHTDVPTTFRQFLMQRLRWDGDLYFLFVRKHQRNLSPRLMGWPDFLMTLVTGLFFQLVMPFLIVSYLVVGFILMPLSTIAFVAVLIYSVYFAITLTLYLACLLLVSERPREDLKLLPLVPLFPVFMLVIRCWGVVCTLNEALRRGHEESSMAPWWVIKRGKKF
ncbi:glycosyltransferase family 2 protein [Marinobacter zhejiangensis]|uniref:Glycosyltransferase, catalytic subunit of cellulose synthase and poly-beta-1,6-N-acetylglucosamine synthase n=1 Tax=Marinobacter zhejiangensis TaxID=488535 RepID=A0A1I4M921_9GAMM|nr:glycosyltransferase [Marinobacter zhejiangensis]SFL99699.1 Glycosyltransferase, catalytic subunit of cellulose synthase and poly-beta-1,6-N-acetylglucosamine synthase [Marinobacter zhejiangensis]